MFKIWRKNGKNEPKNAQCLKKMNWNHVHKDFWNFNRKMLKLLNHKHDHKNAQNLNENWSKHMFTNFPSLKNISNSPLQLILPPIVTQIQELFFTLYGRVFLSPPRES